MLKKRVVNRHRDSDYGRHLYHERSNWSFSLWLFALFMSSSISLSIWAAVGTYSAILISLLQLALLVIAARKNALEISVTKGWLLVGPAAIERAYIHNFVSLDNKELRRVRGVDGDPASYLQLRFWDKRAIKIDIRDARDATPYWLVSTKRGDELVKLLSHADH